MELLVLLLIYVHVAFISVSMIYCKRTTNKSRVITTSIREILYTTIGEAYQTVWNTLLDIA